MSLKKRRIALSVLAVLLPIVVILIQNFISFESFREAFLWIKKYPSCFFFEYIVLSIFGFAIWSATGKLFIAFLIESILMAVLCLVSYFKVKINGMPLVLAEFGMIGEFGEIAGFALSQIKINVQMIVSAVLLAITTALTVFLEWKLKTKNKTRLISGAVSAVLILVFVFTPIFKSWRFPLTETKLCGRRKELPNILLRSDFMPHMSVMQREVQFVLLKGLKK